MIHVDDRIGSKHLAKLLIVKGLPTELIHLDYADIAFDGSGRACGIELKRLDDLIGSLTTKRFQAHQLPGMMRFYQVRFLMVEGLYRESSDGLIERGAIMGTRLNWLRMRSTMTFARLQGTLYTLMFKCGFHILNTRDTAHTAAEIARLYHWWQDYDSHRSHVEGSKEDAPGTAGVALPDPWFNRALHFPEEVALKVPGLGLAKFRAVAKHFRSVRRMAWASAAQWREVVYKNKKGKLVRIGPKLAKKVHEQFLREA